MKTDYRIAVPKPCSEDWDTMQPKGCGRFCNTCKKTVVDFTGFSDQEFIHYFQQAKTIPCGRFTLRQCSIIIPSVKNVPFFLSSRNKYLAAGIVAIVGSAINVAAQTVDIAGQPIRSLGTKAAVTREQAIAAPCKDSIPVTDESPLDNITIYSTKTDVSILQTTQTTWITGVPQPDVVKARERTPPGITTPLQPPLWQRLTRSFRKKKQP